MRVSFGLFLFSLFGNLWIYRLFHLNFFVCVITIVTTICFFLVCQLKLLSESHKSKAKVIYIIFTALFSVLLLLQWQTTNIHSLTNLDNDEQRVAVQRLKEYPPTYIQIGPKTKWLPMGHWFEERKEFLVFQRVEKNLFENLDTNQYFFATHPFERLGFQEFEKFSYLLLPFFVVGVVVLVKGKGRFWTSQNDKFIYLTSFFAPILLLSIIGNRNTLGPFSLFPFFVTSITSGLGIGYKSLKRFSETKRKIILVGFFSLFLLVFIQMILYASN